MGIGRRWYNLEMCVALIALTAAFVLFSLNGCAMTPKQKEAIQQIASRAPDLISHFIPGGGVVTDVISILAVLYGGKKIHSVTKKRIAQRKNGNIAPPSSE